MAAGCRSNCGDDSSRASNAAALSARGASSVLVGDWVDVQQCPLDLVSFCEFHTTRRHRNSRMQEMEGRSWSVRSPAALGLVCQDHEPDLGSFTHGRSDMYL